MTKEYIYSSHDNIISVVLKSDDVAQDLSSVTKITASFDSTLVESTDQAAGAITWDQDGYATGEIRLDLGDQIIAAGRYTAVPIIIYDADNPNGIVWGFIDVLIRADVEAS